MDEKDFLEVAEAKLKEFVDLEKSLAAQEDGVRRRRAGIREDIELLTSSINVYRNLMGLPRMPVELTDDLQLGSIAAMAVDLIQRNRRPMKVVDIVEALETAGKLEKRPGRQNYSSVYSILFRDKRFAKTEQGEFGLAGPAFAG